MDNWIRFFGNYNISGILKLFIFVNIIRNNVLKLNVFHVTGIKLFFDSYLNVCVIRRSCQHLRYLKAPCGM